MSLNKFMVIVVTFALLFILVSMFVKAEDKPVSVLPTTNEIQETMRVQYISQPQQVSESGTVRTVKSVNCMDEKGWTWDITEFAAGLKPVKIGDRVYVTKGISVQPDTERVFVHWVRIDYIITKEDMR